MLPAQEPGRPQGSPLPYTTYLIDLDGVIYRGNALLPGAQEFVAWLDTNHMKYLYLTNNSFASGDQVLAKLTRLGISANAAHLLTAGQAAVQNIARRFPKGSVYVVGEEPLMELVKAQGLSVAPIDSEEADAVLVGLDRDFDYTKLTCAMNAVRAGAAFVTINRDPLLPVQGGFIPGTGSLAAAVEAASGISPEVVGKPEPTLLYEAMHLLDSQPGETVMVGDGLGVDILAGKNAGTHTLLLLSGTTSREALAASTIKPDHVYDDLAALMKDAASNPASKTC
ncbi:MAG TPA: HAD-IIA family hydrolase [Ktedonobacteraceae bacterium]|nr:HAD-IIA family hydrolase [Ktedonobacteraceae bacterium]